MKRRAAAPAGRAKPRVFKARMSGGGTIDVPIGELFTLSGFQFVVHHPIRDGNVLKKWWNVSEYSTGGLAVSEFWDTKRTAKLELEQQLTGERLLYFAKQCSQHEKINV